MFIIQMTFQLLLSGKAKLLILAACNRTFEWATVILLVFSKITFSVKDLIAIFMWAWQVDNHRHMTFLSSGKRSFDILILLPRGMAFHTGNHLHVS